MVTRHFTTVGTCLRRLAWLAGAAFALWASHAVAQTAPAPSFRLRVVGGLAGITQFTKFEEPFWSQELLRLSGGRFGADVVAFDRAGVPGTEMLRLIELGVVPFGTVLLSSMSAQYPQYTAVDLAGLNPDMASLKVSVAAFRPYLEKTLRDQHGVEVLALYTYPAQVLFCKKPLTALTDLAGRRVRVSSLSQADFVGALGGIAVNTAFADIVANFQSGNIECAVTGTMSGNSLGLHHLTASLYPMPLTWGLAAFGANRAAWEALPPDLRAILSRELPKLEASIWQQSVQDTTDGIACNTGAPSCTAGTRAAMIAVAVSVADEQRRQQVFASVVLPRWLQRCGPRCAPIWNQTVGAARKVPLVGKP